MRVIGYIRVSTGGQADSGLGLDDQRRKLTLYCELHGHDLVSVHEDAGASARTLDRPALTEALTVLRRGGADALLVAKLDRATRSTRDLADLLETATRQRWALLSVAEQLDTSSAAGRLVVSVLGAVAQWEREATGERTSAALAVLRARGQHTGGGAPYGYAVGEGGVLSPVDAEIAVVALARSMADEHGWGARRVARALTESGHRPRNGGTWSPTQVARILAKTQEAA